MKKLWSTRLIACIFASAFFLALGCAVYTVAKGYHGNGVAMQKIWGDLPETFYFSSPDFISKNQSTFAFIPVAFPDRRSIPAGGLIALEGSEWDADKMKSSLDSLVIFNAKDSSKIDSVFISKYTRDDKTALSDRSYSWLIYIDHPMPDSILVFTKMTLSGIMGIQVPAQYQSMWKIKKI
jgi:hypothetical protein